MTYTRHNTEIFFLVLFAVLALAALINHRVRSRRHHELPYGIRPITVYESKFDQWPMPGSYEEIVIEVSDEVDQVINIGLIDEMSISFAPTRLIDAWKLIEPDFQTESV
jgi:hypothetical protein